MELQQAMISNIKSQQYQQALSIADRILQSKPDNVIVQELRKTLAEKLSLDDDIESDDIDGEEDSSSESEAASSQDEDTESQDEAASLESGSSEGKAAAASPAIPVCDVLHVNADHTAVSVQQRKQLRSALKDQLEDLKVEQAAQKMRILGL